jgi:Zn-dependent peptidase ImmA (M78 family)/transcriptional regulator with XRE-family HTH domain
MTSEREFVGARLELARAFQHVTLTQLAATVSVSAPLLSMYENGLRKQPAVDLVDALARALKVAPGFFFEPLRDIWTEAECSFRRRAVTPEGLKKRARAHGTLIGLVVQQLAEHLRFPAYNVPAIKATTNPEVEDAARTCREHWKVGLGPITHIGRIAERNGVVLVQHLRHADKIDAFARRGVYSMIVLNTARVSTSRWIFDVAHELGHFVLHPGIETGAKETEHQANLFAASLLLPRKTFGREFASRPFSWAHVFDLKRRWSASAGAIVRHAHYLGLLDAIGYRRAYQYMSAQGWTKKEPHEPSFVGPEWLPSAFELAAKRFDLTGGALCERLYLMPSLFTDVTGVPVERVPPPIQFKPKLVRSA